MQQILDILGPLIPADLRPLLEDPSLITDPRSWPGLVRTVWPIARMVVVILAFYIVWSTISAVFGYFSRFMRFAIRIGPIIGFLGWVMANSGQGNLGEVFELAKQWAGFGPANIQNPNLSSWAGATRNAGSSSAGRRTTPKRQPGKQEQAGTDFLSSILRSAIGGQGEDAQNIIQSFVKQSLAKAAGLEAWLGGESDTQDKKKRTR